MDGSTFSAIGTGIQFDVEPCVCSGSEARWVVGEQAWELYVPRSAQLKVSRSRVTTQVTLPSGRVIQAGWELSCEFGEWSWWAFWSVEQDEISSQDWPVAKAAQAVVLCPEDKE